MRFMIGLLCSVPVLVGCYASHTRSIDSDGGLLEEPGICVIPVPPCAVDAECGPTPPWACRSGRCAYVGCEGDAQCDPGRACVRSSGVGECFQRCRRTSECVVLSGLEGPSECRDGVCRPGGCPSAGWCLEYAGRGRWRCEPNPRSFTSPELPVCREICERDSDCSSARSACVDGYCGTAPCRSDEECRARFDDERLQCRSRS